MMEKKVFTLVLFILVLAGCMGICIPAYSREIDRRNEKIYYQRFEQEYKEKLRDCLEQFYCKNSGINLTSVRETDGTRNYIVRIHHRHIESMTTDQKGELLKAVGEIRLFSGQPDVTVTFL